MEKNKEDIYRKIELLCYGLKTNDVVEEIYDKQNPYDLTRTGNVGLQLLVGKRELAANVPVFNHFTDKSPFMLHRGDNGLYAVNENTGANIKIQALDAPSWYKKKVTEEYYAGQYLLREGVNTLICSISNSCGYVAKNAQCRFCAIGKNTSNNINELDQERKRNIIKALSIAVKDAQKIEKSINLTGGNTFSDDRGASRYIDFVKSIRSETSIPICIEMSPPKGDTLLIALKEVGADGVMMNIEVWDESLRQMYMPGKALIQRSEYIQSWKCAVKLFGKGNVSSVIIIGLENKESVKEAIDEMIELGVMPSIMPFRPNDGAILEKFPVADPELVMELTEYVAEKSLKNQINIIDSAGCIGCGACAAEKDMMELLGG